MRGKKTRRGEEMRKDWRKGHQEGGLGWGKVGRKKRGETKE